MLPNFLIIGTQKAATTWLAKCLGEHPDVFMSEPKELYYFTHLERGLDWYKAHFKDATDKKAIGEASPGYIIHSDVPEKVKSILGERVKIIASLRHPVDRAYSAFGHHIREGRLPVNADFRTCFLKDEMHLRRRGFYTEDLERYFDNFESRQILTLIFEEIKRDNYKTLSDCFNFLEVDTKFLPEYLNVKVNKGVDHKLYHGKMDKLRRKVSFFAKKLPFSIQEPVMEVGRHIYHKYLLGLLPTRSKYGSLSPELRDELIVEFLPEINKLESLLKRDLSIWYASTQN